MVSKPRVRAELCAAVLTASLACSEIDPSDRADARGDGAAIVPAFETEPIAHDPDDPAIWVSPRDPAKSLILGTDKVAGRGGLYVFDLHGRVRQTIAPLDRPNNVDVEYGFAFDGGQIDIAVLTERIRRRLRVFAIPADGGALIDLAPAGLPVLEGETGEAGAPMGVALYKRPRDSAMFVIVTPKTGMATDYLWQYRLDARGREVTASLVRRFGAFSGVGAAPDEAGEIEAVTVDDALGFVYYADERAGIRKWHADPAAPQAGIELALFGREGYLGDREGLSMYERADGTGYLLSSDQVEGSTRVHVYPREGARGAPHDHRTVAVINTRADNTDGLESTSHALPGFPRGLLVMMHSGARRFQVYGWDAVAARIAH